MWRKKLPSIVSVRAEFEATVWGFQLIEFTGPTSFISLVESEMRTNRIAFANRCVRRQSIEDATMDSTCDIFKETPDGPLWVEAVHGLAEAKARMACLALMFDGEYFIHSHEKDAVTEEAQEWADVISRAFAVPTQIKSNALRVSNKNSSERKS
jgi:hypothetical protein